MLYEMSTEQVHGYIDSRAGNVIKIFSFQKDRGLNTQP